MSSQPVPLNDTNPPILLYLGWQIRPLEYSMVNKSVPPAVRLCTWLLTARSTSSPRSPSPGCRLTRSIRQPQPTDQSEQRKLRGCGILFGFWPIISPYTMTLLESRRYLITLHNLGSNIEPNSVLIHNLTVQKVLLCIIFIIKKYRLKVVDIMLRVIVICISWK